MNIQEYQKQALRTFPNLGEEFNRQHMILGIFSEVGELADAYKKELAYKKPLDRVNLIEEVVDVFWYIVNLQNMFDKVPEDLKEIEWPEDNDDYNPSQDACPADYLYTFLSHLDLRERSLSNFWYTVCLKLGLTKEEMEKGLENNINKLKVRYPDSFSEEKALKRDLEKERVELEK